MISQPNKKLKKPEKSEFVLTFDDQIVEDFRITLLNDSIHEGRIQRVKPSFNSKWIEHIQQL